MNAFKPKYAVYRKKRFYKKRWNLNFTSFTTRCGFLKVPINFSGYLLFFWYHDISVLALLSEIFVTVPEKKQINWTNSLIFSVVLIAILHQTIAKNDRGEGRRKSFGKVIFWKIIIVSSSFFSFTYFFHFQNFQFSRWYDFR